MSDKALYRKYRPSNFNEVFGQDHIVKVLKGSIELGNISHSYIFFGSRGTGKTSVARIVARSLDTKEEDIIEIDAASNRGIDDIRELREGVKTLPFNSKYKVYIIDEVHMLTKEAWNALLKTLEEPPSHVIFILATTEIEKVPETIISRCQVFTFKKPTQDILKNLILNISQKEKIKIEDQALELIALLGDGSFRDTYGILQKVISYSKDKKITLSEVESVTGAPSFKLVGDFLTSLSKGDINLGIKTLNSVTENNFDFEIFLKIVLIKIRLALLLRYAPEMKKEILKELNNEEAEFILNLLSEKGGHITSSTLEILLETESKLKYASIKSLPIELALMKIIQK